LPKEAEFSWSDIPSKGRSPGSQDPYFFLTTVPFNLVFAYGRECQDDSMIPQAICSFRRCRFPLPDSIRHRYSCTPKERSHSSQHAPLHVQCEATARLS
ncbi:hypothetical protein, partial [Microseira sp. BLCC-F43]|uniref:hypothetical protein n=1 Tax=Microseira sp. BLCC-F43 TaxID=3153602 RepID=UPI0035B96C9C